MVLPRILRRRLSRRGFVGLSAAVAAGAVVGVVAATEWPERQPPAPSSVKSPFTPLPNVRGLSVAAAIRRVEAAGYRPYRRGSPDDSRTYLLRGWIKKYAYGFVRPQWGRVACGARYAGNGIEVWVARRRRDCDESKPAVPPFMAFRRGRVWVAAQGTYAHIQLWSPRLGFRVLPLRTSAGGRASAPHARARGTPGFPLTYCSVRRGTCALLLRRLSVHGPNVSAASASHITGGATSRTTILSATTPYAAACRPTASRSTSWTETRCSMRRSSPRVAAARPR